MPNENLRMNFKDDDLDDHLRMQGDHPNHLPTAPGNNSLATNCLAGCRDRLPLATSNRGSKLVATVCQQSVRLRRQALSVDSDACAPIAQLNLSDTF